MSSSPFRVGIVGMGPRGLSVLERLCANMGEIFPNGDVEIHVIDPYPFGAGNVWRTNQSRTLIMNTVASQVTVFTDPSVQCEGPHIPGPSLYEWAHYISLMDHDGDYDDTVRDEARKLEPDSYPTRAFYGYYLEWVYKRLVNNLPPNTRLYSHLCYAVGLDDAPDGQQVIHLENESTPLIVDAVVLTLGHTQVAPTGEIAHLLDFSEKYGLFYVPPANPADVNLDPLKPGEPVILRGLGLNFFDYMAMLSVGRGGQFVRQNGKLVYKASGYEPRMYAGSRRGIPYHARGENEKGASGRYEPLVLTQDIIREFRNRSARGERIEFRKEVWPFIAKEVETLYYTTLIRSRHCDCQAKKFQDQYLQLPWGSEEEKHLLEEYKVAQADRWDWERLAYPYKDTPLKSQQDYRVWLLEYLRQDLAEARKGNVSGPLKAAVDALRDLRNEVRLIVDYGEISGDSYRDDLEGWYTPVNAFLSIGPPASRIEEMIALIEAGVLEVLGPDLRIETIPDSPGFRAYSSYIDDSAITSQALIEARLPDLDLRRTTNPLLSYLFKTGQCQPYRITNSDGTYYETGGLAVTPPPNRLIDQNGIAHPRRYAFGVPTEGVHWVTAAGIRPGVNSVTLTESDAIARAILNHFVESNKKKLVYP